MDTTIANNPQRDLLPYTQETGNVKSILKSVTRSNLPEQSLEIKASNTNFLPKEAKKRVEITTPQHSSNTSIKHQKHMALTPLPRVAFLTPKTTTIDKAKPKVTLGQKGIKSKNSPATPHPPMQRAKASGSTSKIQSRKTASLTTNLASSASTGTYSAKAKKIKKKKKKSKSMSDVTEVPVHIGPPAPLKIENAGKEYVQELATINDLLKSVTQHIVGPEAVQGFIRPFSSNELQQLLASVEKVATIHQNHHSAPLEAPQPQVATAPEAKPGEESEKKAENSQDTESTSAPKKKRKKSRKVKKSKSKSSNAGSVGRKSTNANNEKEEPKPIPAKGAANKNLASKKTLKSNVKSLKKSKADRAGDLQSDLSELDLVKSAMLNRRYYEESMALEDTNSTEEERKKHPTRKVSSAKKRASIKEVVKRLQVPHNTPRVHATGSPSSSIPFSTKEKEKSLDVSYIESYTSDKTAASGGGGNSNTALVPIGLPQLPLPELSLADKDDAYHKALGNVLINYSHVLRPPPKTSDNQLDEVENRSVALSKQKLDNDADLAGFDKRFEKLKQLGLITRGVLDIDQILLPHVQPNVVKKNRSRSSIKESQKKQESLTAISTGKNPSKTDVLSSDGSTPQSKKSKTRRLSRSRSRSQERKKSPVKEKQAPAHAVKSVPPTGSVAQKTKATSIPSKQEPQIVNLSPPHPAKWHNESVVPSVFQGFPDETGSNRWSLLNIRMMERNKQLQAKQAAGHRQVPKDDLDHIRRKVEASDGRKVYLQNLEKAKKAFDSFGIHDMTERKTLWKTGKTQTNGQDTKAFKKK